jgi:N-acyl-phosphatidylethanolamine-hydrolysing phospholipase D
VCLSLQRDVYLSIYLSINRLATGIACVHPRDDFGRPRLWPRVHLSIHLSILTTDLSTHRQHRALLGLFVGASACLPVAGAMFSRMRRSMRPSPRDARPSGLPAAHEVQAGLQRLESITIRSQKDANGRYEHPPEHFPGFVDHGFSGFRKWRRTVEPIPTLSPEELERSLPVSKPSAAALASPPQGPVMQVAWLGHASVLAQWDGWSVLADPIFSHRCAPVQFAGPARVRPAPVSADELPPIDAIVISHNHYDHLDLSTVVALASRAQPTPPVWFVPLGTKAWMAGAGVSNVVEMDWAQRATLRCTQGGSSAEGGRRPDLLVTCLPCQHWCARTPFDRNACLWASWHVSTHSAARGTASSGASSSRADGARSCTADGGSYYFAGDTGYCGSVFENLGKVLGGIDVAAIPIGAYGAPGEVWFHEPNHMSPEGAVRCRADLQAKHAVAVHWGTFQLTSEPLLEPPKRLRAAAAAAGLLEEEFVVMAHGEVRCFPCQRP